MQINIKTKYKDTLYSSLTSTLAGNSYSFSSSSIGVGRTAIISVSGTVLTSCSTNLKVVFSALVDLKPTIMNSFADNSVKILQT